MWWLSEFSGKAIKTIKFISVYKMWFIEKTKEKLKRSQNDFNQKKKKIKKISNAYLTSVFKCATRSQVIPQRPVWEHFVTNSWTSAFPVSLQNTDTNSKPKWLAHGWLSCYKLCYRTLGGGDTVMI